MRQGEEHGRVVDAWLRRAPPNVAVNTLLRLFEAALGALWNRTSTTLGEVTLIAITDRVLYDAARRFPPFASLKVNAAGVVDFGELKEHAFALGEPQLRREMRFVLVEFLTVLGNLTAGLLTEELHAELARVATPKKRQENKAPRRKLSKPGKTADEDNG